MSEHLNWCWYKSTSPSFQVIQYVEVKLVLKFIGLKVIPWSWRPWFLLPRSRTVCCRPLQRPPAGKAVWRRRCSRSRACASKSSRPASMWSSTHVESSPRGSSMTQQSHQPRYRVIFSLKLIKARLGVSRPIYANVDSPNLGFPYFNFLGGNSEEKNTLYLEDFSRAS